LVAVPAGLASGALDAVALDRLSLWMLATKHTLLRIVHDPVFA